MDGACNSCRGDELPADAPELLAEAHGTYATGLLAIALTADQFADEAVRAGTICSLARHLRRSVLGSATEHASSQQAPAQRSASKVGTLAARSNHKAPPSVPGISSTTSASPTSSHPEMSTTSSAEATAAAEQLSRLHDQAESLRALREWYSLQGVACLGEYLECLAPVMQVRPFPLPWECSLPLRGAS